MNDCIMIDNLVVFANHGVLKEEKTMISPFDGFSRPAIILSRVDFPLPLFPMIFQKLLTMPKYARSLRSSRSATAALL